MSTTPQAADVRRATLADAGQVIQLLTDAFYGSEPFASWLIPAGGVRRGVYADYFRIFVDHALCHGAIDVVGNLSGVALWFPHTEPIAGPARYRELLHAAVGGWIERFLMVDESFAQNHPATPHHHLGYLAVRPDQQGNGVGSALLASYHARLDKAGLPAYLEASNERNYRLYVRHGYRTEGPVQLPDGGPLWWPMWRSPGSRHSAQSTAMRAETPA